MVTDYVGITRENQIFSAGGAASVNACATPGPEAFYLVV
jgi:hypothetical protein